LGASLSGERRHCEEHYKESSHGDWVQFKPDCGARKEI